MTRNTPEIMEVDAKRLEDLLRRAEGKLDEKDYELIQAIFRSYTYVADLVGDKNTTINRLRKLFFGAKTEKTSAVLGRDKETTQPGSSEDGTGDAESAEDEPADPRQQGAAPSPQDENEAKAPGHGRNAASAYQGGETIEVSLPLEPGDACPHCRQGVLYGRPPGVLVRIVGQAPLQARIYELQKVRCGLCGKVFTAEAPPEAGARKYDETAASMMALLKYGAGMPFNRLERLQRSVEIPLPSSTQWDVIAAYSPNLVPVYEELIRQAAQGEVLHNDDTTVRILELMGQRRGEAMAEGDANRRTGLFTSGVVSILGDHRVALFFSGRQHAGENLADVLRHRAEELATPIQMCDALSRNLPGDLQVIVANCLAHARRRFVDVADRFRDECEYVLDMLSIVYRTDAEARKRKLPPAKRLRLHRAKSQQPMARLHNWLQRQFKDRLVEPNSALGEAIQYMLNHWEKLTRFLDTPGAPLDNNVVERALRKSILHRKNALFFKTRRGAMIGDMHMSLIYTCELCDASPFDYLTQLHLHADEVAEHPEDWMPWNHQASRQTAAVQPAR